MKCLIIDDIQDKYHHSNLQTDYKSDLTPYSLKCVYALKHLLSYGLTRCSILPWKPGYRKEKDYVSLQSFNRNVFPISIQVNWTVY